MAEKPVYRMSSSGKCPRALSAEHLGYEPAPAKPWLEQAAEEGRWHEQRIVEELRAAGEIVSDQQAELKLEYPTFDMVGHIDGVVYTGEPKLLEIKSMSQFEFDRWKRGGFDAFPEYAAQVTCYMTALGLKDALYIVKNRNNGYTERLDIVGCPVPVEQIVQQIEQVEESVQLGRLHEAQFDPQSIQCQRCDYQHLCITSPEPGKADIAKLDAAVAQWRKGKALVDEGQSYIDAAREVLGEYARGLDTKRFIHNHLAVQLIVQHRVSYDRKTLESTIPVDMLMPARKEQDIEQLRINDTAKEQNGEK